MSVSRCERSLSNAVEDRTCFQAGIEPLPYRMPWLTVERNGNPSLSARERGRRSIYELMNDDTQSQVHRNMTPSGFATRARLCGSLCLGALAICGVFRELTMDRFKDCLTFCSGHSAEYFYGI